MFNKKELSKGFTLIELLVVVLIIGILVAIALPYYQKAVEHSRIAEAKTVLKTLEKAVEMRGVATGEASLEIDDLDISVGKLEGRVLVTSYYRVLIDEYACSEEGQASWTCGCYVAERIGGDYSVHLGGENYDSGVPGVFYCMGENENACKKAGAEEMDGGEWVFL